MMVALFMINDLLTNPSNHPYLDNFAVMVIPCVNPDGFTYAWTTNRLWRKVHFVISSKVFQI